MHKQKLLLINSSQVFMDLTKKILEREGYSVRCAVGLAGACEQLMDYLPDGIVLENDLPDVKGFDLCRDLRNKSDIPIMFISNIKEDELPALQAGANDFLKKPYDFEIMKVRLNIMLNTGFSAIESEDAENLDLSTILSLEAKEKEKQPQTVPVESVDKSINEKGILHIRRLYVGLAACFIFILIGAGIYTMLGNRLNYFQISDEQTPLTEAPIQMAEDAKPYTGSYQGISFPGADSVSIPAETTNVNMFLLNPENNPCYFVFEIFLTDTGEPLYSSGMTKPGMYIDEIMISRGLAKGEYNATLKVRTYALEDFTAISFVNMEFCLTVS